MTRALEAQIAQMVKATAAAQAAGKAVAQRTKFGADYAATIEIMDSTIEKAYVASVGQVFQMLRGQEERGRVRGAQMLVVQRQLNEFAAEEEKRRRRKMLDRKELG